MYINHIDTEKAHNKELQKIAKELRNEELKKISILLKKDLEDSWFKNNTINYFLHVGGTNSGKTYNSLQAMLSGKSGIYLSPLRLLAFEVYDKIKKLGYACNLITGEERIIEDNAVFTAATVEMMAYNKKYETVVIDECFMIGDSNRGKSWLKAILESNTDNIHIISSLESENILTNILEKTNKEFTVNRYIRKVPLISNVKKKYPIDKPYDKTIFILFSRISVLEWKYKMEQKGSNVSVLYGNLPPDVKKEQMNKFITGENNICISTDVIAFGLNLPCDHIVFLSDSKFDGFENRKLNSTEIKQIGGRAGRYLMSEVGNVWYHDMNANKMHSKFNDTSDILNIAYCGIKEDILFDLTGLNLYEKLLEYKKLNFIPDTLSDMIILENIDNYISMYLDNTIILNKLDEMVAWKLLLLPVKPNTMDYWKHIVHKVYKDETIKLDINSDSLTSIADINHLKLVEDEIANIELYSYLYNMKVFDSLVVEKDIYEEYINSKNVMINNITSFLLNKKLSNVKLCVSCAKNIGVGNPHKMCDKCFYASRKNYWNY